MHALVTGGGGFLGRRVVELLVEAGHQVRTFSRKQYPELESLAVEQCAGDIADASAVRDACRGVESVFHTVAIAGVWGPWEMYHRTNTLGTQHVVDACRREGVRRLVFTSSPSVTFAAGPQENVDESAPYPEDWLCAYPHTKALAEQKVLEAHSDTLLTCALRPHLIWGPGDPHLIPRVIDRAKSGRLRRVGDGTNLVDMVYVDNAAWAHLDADQALTAGRAGGMAFFISQGTPVNCWDWINQILELAGVPPVTKSISFPTAWRLGHLLETVYRWLGKRSEPPMTRFVAAQLAHSHYFSIAAAERELGYHARVSTEDGMTRLGEALA